jgi:Cu-Zn family superoxide dismutase
LALAVVIAGGAVFALRPTDTQAVEMRGFAPIRDAGGQTIGMATFVENAAGDVTLTVEAGGLTPGAHGMHIHTVGSCVGPDFVSAGGHFNPLNRRHGLQTSDGAHAGDMPNLIADANGRARFSMTVSRVTLSPGVLSVMDPDGSALVIHAASDDGMTDATGNSGGRVACGVIALGTPPALLLPAGPALGMRPPSVGDAGLAALKAAD